MLSARDISKTVGDFALRKISLDVEVGEYFVLLGASGAGKTILLEMIAGLLELDEGNVLLDGENITQRSIQHRGVALVYQEKALFPHLTVFGNIAYGLKCSGMNSAAIKKKVKTLAEEMGVSTLLDRLPHTLSGGEGQRVALARALARGPKCLLLDEPLSSLDARARGELRALLRQVNRHGQTILHVTHDYEEAVSLASRIAIMEDGAVVQTGTPDEVFRHPRSDFVAGFVGIRNFIKGELNYEDGTGQLGEFRTGGPVFHVLTDAPAGAGYVMLRTEDITISLDKLSTSARNAFEGRIVDIARAKLGVEVSVDIGIEVSVTVTSDSVDSLGLECGKSVWVNFKASAAKFFGE
ncbi:ABC transporter ATP-binding protein [Candidatus Hydrogenedentota bacterium]